MERMYDADMTLLKASRDLRLVSWAAAIAESDASFFFSTPEGRDALEQELKKNQVR